MTLDGFEVLREPCYTIDNVEFVRDELSPFFTRSSGAIRLPGGVAT